MGQENIKMDDSLKEKTDPFYSEKNLDYLCNAISDIKSGKSELTEHELIED